MNCFKTYQYFGEYVKKMRVMYDSILMNNNHSRYIKLSISTYAYTHF